MSATAELREELLRGLDYYAYWEDEAAHNEEVEKQRWIAHEIEGNGYAILAYNGSLLELGKLVATQHAHGWLELHVLPKLNAAIPEAPKTLKEQAERGELMIPEVELELDRLEAEVAHWKSEARRWRHAHASVTSAKRQLSAKYGAIMSRKLRARLRRTRKRIKRRFT